MITLQLLNELDGRLAKGWRIRHDHIAALVAMCRSHPALVHAGEEKQADAGGYTLPGCSMCYAGNPCSVPTCPNRKIP